MGVILPLLVGGVLAPAYADQANPYQREIDKGRAYLLSKLKSQNQLGYFGLALMALIKTAPSYADGPNKGKPKKEPELQEMMDKFVKEVEEKEKEFNDQEGTYAIGVAVSCLVADDAGKHERIIRKLVARIIANQRPNGCWTYPSGSPPEGDTSQTQYIVLALWDASVAGVEIPPRVWDSVLDWQIKTQDASGDGGPGGFVYQPKKIPEDGKIVDQGGDERCTMGVAGLSTLLICQGQLPALKRKGSAKVMLIDELIRPAVDDPDDKGYTPKVTPDMVHRAVDLAEGWVGRNSVFQGKYKDAPRVNYYLYGFERVAALKKSLNNPIKVDWYHNWGNVLAKSQKADGSWNNSPPWSEVADTAFALLFLGKTMEKKLAKINVEVLQRSLAIGGSGGLPTADGTSGGSAFQRQYDRYKTQPTSSIDDLVKIFEDPDKIVEEETTAQVEQLTADQLKELVQKVGGDSRKMRQWAYDTRPEARKAALTALSRSRDPRFVPILIDALQVWWARHPLHTAGLVAAEASRKFAAPIAERRPMTLILSAVLLGAILALTRPWRWLLRPALFAGLLPALVSRVMKELPVDSLIRMFGSAPARSAAKTPGTFTSAPLASVDPANPATAAATPAAVSPAAQPAAVPAGEFAVPPAARAPADGAWKAAATTH